MKGVMKVIVLCSLILHAFAVGLSHPQPSLTLSRTPTDIGCLLCGIVVNEIEGFSAENMTESDIEAFLQKDICSHLPTKVQPDCDDLIDLIPDAIAKINAGESVGMVCVENNFCVQPFSEQADPTGVPTYIIDLDLPPEQRLNQVCANATFKAVLTNLIDAMANFFDNSTILIDLGKTLNQLYFPKEYAAEIRGCADVIGLDYGLLTIINLGYELSDACTSIVAQTPSGTILHARNMDFWDGIWFTGHLKNLTYTAQYQQGGKTVFYATTFASYVGVLSGMKCSAQCVQSQYKHAVLSSRYAFVLLITASFFRGVTQLFYEVIAALTEKNASLVSFLSREVLMNEDDFESAIANLSNDTLIADVYYIIAGTTAGQGAVITRNRENASDIWRLQAPDRWFEVQTNYDHWVQPPWFDDRVKPASEGMTALGQANVSLPGMFGVLSVKPVLNLQSTFSMLACPATGYYESLMRNCPYPCSE